MSAPSFRRSLRSGLLGLGFGVALAALAGPALAQDAPDTMIVFDGSGSMWGQIDGRHKIEIARDTLSSVLSESVGNQRMGMIAYGHRRKGQCSDIETVVPVGPAQSTVPAMLDAARGLNPKGKTPLSDAVRRAADELRYAENAATVVLVTDGIETCEADPCALAAELERSGIDFTAHVVGFGLSDEEGRQVACLADNTGGLYIQASNADDLSDALSRTIARAPIEVSEEDFIDPVPTAREVHFLLRDGDGSDLLGIRQLTASVEATDGSPIEADAFGLNYPEASGRSATATLEPDAYRLTIERAGGSRGGYATTLDFEVPQGGGVHVVEASLSGELVITGYVNPNLPANGSVPIPSPVRSGRAWAYYSVYPVVDGAPAKEPVVSGAYEKLRFPLAAGTYLVRGVLDRTVAAEQIVDVRPGAPTEIDFSFDATRVYVDARQTDGSPVKRQTTYWYDKPRQGRNYFRSGGGASGDEIVPFYMPTGTWVLNVGGEGYGKRRSELLVEVPGDFSDMRLEIGEGRTLSEDDAARITPCAEMVTVKYAGCLPAPANAADSSQPKNPREAVASDGDADGASGAVPAALNDFFRKRPASEASSGSAMFGVFALDESGASVEEVVGDYLHVSQCQRSPVVAYPDGTIAFKRFMEPRSMDDNPYADAASSAACTVADGRHECTLTDPNGDTQPFDFTARPLGDGHFEMCREGAASCTIAASCFHPDGELNAADIMPNGRSLGELMAERPGGGDAGFGFNADNKAVLR